MSTAPKKNSYTYRDAGVDIEAGNALVDAIKPLVATTERPGTMGAIGGFGGLFDLGAAGYKSPVLVAATDGVGTKLKIAAEIGLHETVGIDLVAMCVNDLVVQGAEPLFFLDYFATGKLSPEVARDVIAGIAEGCRQAGCALIGGETAEMPGMYGANDYDLAGFSVGAAERDKLLPNDIAVGDLVLGLASNGVHSNGYSLVRRLIADHSIDMASPAPFQKDQTLGEALLAPTRIYAKPLMGCVRAGKVNALAHITGGGLTENLPRVLPQGMNIHIDLNSWTLPPVFAWLDKLGGIGPKEMLRTFNCGIGMAVIAPKKNIPLLKKSLEEAGETVFDIGEITKGESDKDPETHYSGKLSPAD